MGKKATITEDQLSQVMMLISGTDQYRGLLDYSSEELTTDVMEKLYSAWEHILGSINGPKFT
jgi:hypothetical protein